MPSDLQTLDSIPEIFDALGGIPAICSLIGATGERSWQQVDNWRKRGRLASHTYVVLQDALRERGFQAPPALWGMIEPADGADFLEVTS